ncbi:hypothetical protein N7481_010875 [Penicillium waksmanii]|uniref:uncharacterized protein n=1 Tax=Penicillium waksmanii TaxID=69791 RepID=UPI002548550F|nr:uncharacterized protein N7481_010875 [Penicillium waksmanii]KAJ5973665.1 hypothetical protein N7481_010875 [Penicillium waksmanii]
MSSSSWPWHFITVSGDDKIRRRELLDIRGSYAQWSVIIVMSVLRVYQAWVTHSAASANGTASSRPRRGPASWWDRPLVTGWIETRRQYFVCGLWLLWLTGLSIWNSGEDYLHLTKALAHVALSQVPLQILMSPAAYISTSKPSASSIFSYLTSIPQATVTPYHRLFGRAVISPLLFAHATLYLLFFVQSEHPDFGILLFKRVRDFDVQCGLLAVSMTILLLLFARPRGVASKGALGAGSMQERRRLFYYVHVFLVVVLCAAAYCHVAQAQKYMIQALGASLLNGVCSFLLVRWGGRS